MPKTATDSMAAIISDIRHSAKVDDYEIPQIAFLEAIADRLDAVVPVAVEGESAIVPLAILYGIVGSFGRARAKHVAALESLLTQQPASSAPVGKKRPYVVEQHFHGPVHSVAGRHDATVTDWMVERAWAAYWDHPDSGDQGRDDRPAMRNALAAALQEKGS